MMEIGNLVRIEETGQVGTVRILEGYPPWAVYVELTPGPDTGYIRTRMRVSTGIKTLKLNVYSFDQVEVVEG